MGKQDGQLIIRGDMDPNHEGGYSFGVVEDYKEEQKKTDITILIQGIVTPYKKNSEGDLIKVIAIPWKAIIEKLDLNPRLMFEIPPHKWEEIIAASYDIAGFEEVILTPRSNDHGRDIIAVKRGVGSVRIINSVKAYREGKRVRYDDIRALLGVLSSDFKTSKGILTTTSDFPSRVMNDPLIRPLIPSKLELVNGTELNKWLQELAKK